MDGNNTAIWGWSYGGFASASALALDDEHVFKCAMSVAPVTNWIYYGNKQQVSMMIRIHIYPCIPVLRFHLHGTLYGSSYSRGQREVL